MISSSAVPDAALRLLVDNGFDATSVDALAEAAGISRSTFFRRFGSKEEMVFADQEAIIHHLETVLATSSRAPLRAVVSAALAVFDQHTARPEAAALRHRLLQEVPALRDRELISTHRYERAFSRFLADAELFTLASGRALALGYAAAVVAVHNDHLRDWLKDNAVTHRSALETDLLALASLFEARMLPAVAATPAPTTPAPTAPAPTTVIVTVNGAGADTEVVLAQVRQALESAQGN